MLRTEDTIPEKTTLLDLAEQYFGVDSSHLPTEHGLLFEALIAETLRIAASSVSENNIVCTVCNIHSIQNWTMRKTRWLMPQKQDKLAKMIGDIVSNQRNSSLSLIGDLIPLSQGYYSLPPERAVPIKDGIFLLISGRPTRRFIEADFNIRINGISRWIIETSESELSAKKIPIQQQSNYIGYDPQLFSDPIKFIEQCLRRKDALQDIKGRDTVYYLGPVANRPGIQWSRSGMMVLSLGESTIKICKSPREFERFDHFLKCESHTKRAYVPLAESQVMRTILSMDAAVNKQRIVHISKDTNSINVAFDFPPPIPEVRWMAALGGRLIHSQYDAQIWQFPIVISEEINKLLNGMWLRVD